MVSLRSELKKSIRLHESDLEMRIPSVDTRYRDAPTEPICQVQPQKGDKFKFNLFLLVGGVVMYSSLISWPDDPSWFPPPSPPRQMLHSQSWLNANRESYLVCVTIIVTFARLRLSYCNGGKIFVESSWRGNVTRTRVPCNWPAHTRHRVTRSTSNISPFS